jgi:hypothetical protein
MENFISNLDIFSFKISFDLLFIRFFKI